MVNTLKNFALLIFMFSVWSCDIADNKPAPYDQYAMVYDIDSIQKSIHTLDMQEMPDGGMLMLCRTENNNAFLLRTSKEGERNWSKEINGFFNPLSTLLHYGNDYYFIALSENYTAGTFLLKVNDATHDATVVNNYVNNLRPLHAAKTNDNGLLIINYDPENERTVVLKFNASFELDNNFDKDGRKDFNLQMNDILLEKLNNYVYHLDQVPLPFFCGQLSAASGSLLFFNSFYKSDISLVFLDPVSGDAVKRLTGYQYQKCATDLLETGANSLSYGRYEYERSLISVNVALGAVTPITNLSDFTGIAFGEIASKSSVKLKLLQVKGRQVLMVAANTRGNMVVLYAYDPVTKTLLGTKYAGERFSYQLGNFIATSDGGIAIGCQTEMTGRFARPAIFKFSALELEAMIP